MGVSNEPLNIPGFATFLISTAYLRVTTDISTAYLYEALDFVAKGKVKVMTEIFPLGHISQAYDKVANGQVRFRAVIVPTK